MKTSGDLSFIDGIDELRAMPSLTMEVLEMLNASHFDTKAIKEKIQLDPAMAAFILKFCNSPFLGIKVPIVNLRYALDIIGPTTSKSILMSYLLRNLSDKSAKLTFAGYLWEHSIQVALIARELTAHLNLKQMEEEAYLAGLLHDIGKLAIYLFDPENYENLMLEVDMKRQAILPLETGFYGFSHTEAGNYLLNRWGLPQMLKDSARCHHDIQNYPGNEEVVTLAAFANSTFHYAIERQDELPEFFLKAYGLSEEKYNKMLDSIYLTLAKSQAELSGLL
ncbi:MAG: HDOD domain-containing protein [bacterium]|nr:HDOD domain-containing protein [bacterium]